MKKPYTVVGLWMDSSPSCRVAAHVMANDPQDAERRAIRGEGTDGDTGDLLVAGVFEGHLIAVDEQ